MHNYMQEIEFFEAEGNSIRQRFYEIAERFGGLSVMEIVERDELLERCQKNIDRLHKAVNESVK